MLPNDVLILLFSELDVDSLLNSRLVCQLYHDLIQTHIFSLSRAVARNTFPGSPRILLPPDDGIYNLRWLKRLRRQQMGAILIECGTRTSYSKRPHYWASAEEPRYDDLKNQIACGLETLAQFSRIAKEVDALAPHELRSTKEIDFPITSAEIKDKIGDEDIRERERDMATQHYGTTVRRRRIAHSLFGKPHNRPTILGTKNYTLSDDIEMVWRREWEICRLRIEFARSLPLERLKNFLIMFECLGASFGSMYMRWNLDPPHSRWLLLSGKKSKIDRSYTTWAGWCVLKEGPQMFWHQWWKNRELGSSHSTHYVRDTIYHCWDDRSFLQRAVEQEVWADTLWALKILRKMVPHIYQRSKGLGDTGVPQTLPDVPFLVGLEAEYFVNADSSVVKFFF